MNYLETWASLGAGNGQFRLPKSLAASGIGGKVYIVDSGNNRIQAFVGYGDAIPPETTMNLSGIAGNNGWYTSSVDVYLSATDLDSEVKEIHYQVNCEPFNVLHGATASFTLTNEGYHTVVYYAVDKAGNREPPHTLNVKIDKTAPVITIAGIVDNAIYTLGATSVASFTVIDNLAGVAEQSANLTGGNANGVGSFTYSVYAADNAGNTSSQRMPYSVVYTFSGFISPLSGTSAEVGNNVAVKFQLEDALGNYISGATARLMLQEYAGSLPVEYPIPATSSSEANSGNLFRYVAKDKQYIFNLSTKGLSGDTWQLLVTLDDGTTKTTFINLK